MALISLTAALTSLTCALQARQVMEREFSNLLALGTDRRLDDVSAHRESGALGFGRRRFTGWKFVSCAFLGLVVLGEPEEGSPGGGDEVSGEAGPGHLGLGSSFRTRSCRLPSYRLFQLP